MADYSTEQNSALAQKMLKQQGEINALKADRDALQKRLDWNIDQASQWFQAFREAEMERNRLHACLTGAAVHATRLQTRIAPGSDAWTVLSELRAALQATTEETNDEA